MSGYVPRMPEGDALHRAARRLSVLVGERVEAESPHPRAQVTGVAPRIDGRRLEAVEAVGKNLFLRFEGGITVRSHLRMSGRWRVEPRGAARVGRPWLVLRGADHEAVLWNGPVLEVLSHPLRLGPDVLTDDLSGIRLHGPVGEALLDQRQVSGIGNVWRCEALWHARVSPWADAATVDQQEILAHAHRLMAAALAGERPRRNVYRRAGRECPRCGTPIRSRGQGDDNRIAYWCAACQAGGGPPGE
jgi:endonuclease VIII